MHLVIGMVGKLFPQVWDVLSTLYLWKVVRRQLRRSSHNLNGFLFNHSLPLHVYRLN